MKVSLLSLCKTPTMSSTCSRQPGMSAPAASTMPCADDLRPGMPVPVASTCATEETAGAHGAPQGEPETEPATQSVAIADAGPRDDTSGPQRSMAVAYYQGSEGPSPFLYEVGVFISQLLFPLLDSTLFIRRLNIGIPFPLPAPGFIPPGCPRFRYDTCPRQVLPK